LKRVDFPTFGLPTIATKFAIYSDGLSHIEKQISMG